MERHRHRYEVNPDYIERLEEHGLNFIGKDTAGVRMQVIELKGHPWFVGVQFHPEYLSRVLTPSKPYLGFVASAIGCFDRVKEELLANEALKMPDRAANVKDIASGQDGVIGTLSVNGHAH